MNPGKKEKDAQTVRHLGELIKNMPGKESRTQDILRTLPRKWQKNILNTCAEIAPGLYEILEKFQRAE
ncbi:MAG: hypothetical protein M0P13_07885 [Fibrobacteraceae bacterium]|nr:hypothetical protein [Fibrobacteraceae bacterium]